MVKPGDGHLGWAPHGWHGGGVVGCGQPAGHGGWVVVCGHPPHGWGVKHAEQEGAGGGGGGVGGNVGIVGGIQGMPIININIKLWIKYY